MKTRRTGIGVYIFLLLITTTYIHADDLQVHTDEPVVTDNAENGKVSGANRIDDDFPGSRPESRTAGLEMLYEMAVNFIDEWVVPYTIGSLLQEYNITVWKDFAEPEFYEEWKEWGKDYIGLAVTIAVGLLFIVLMPLIGLLFCCCRCCCTCCCSCCRTPKKGKTSKCKKGTCGFLLFCFTILMAASGLCIFLTQVSICFLLSW